MPKIHVWIDWDSYQKIVMACTLLSAKENREVSIFEFCRQAIRHVLSEDFKGELPKNQIQSCLP